MIQLKNSVNFLKHKSGSVLVEFALIAPLLVLILGATIEISNAVYASQKAQTAATVAGSLVADMNGIKTQDIKNISKLARKIVSKSAGDTPSDYALGVIIIQQAWDLKFKIYKRVQGDATLLNFGFNDIVSNTDVSSGGPVNKAFAEANKLTPSEAALTNDYKFTYNDQIIITKVAIKYKLALSKSISQTLFGSDDITLSYQTTPITPRVFKFRTLPNGSSLP